MRARRGYLLVEALCAVALGGVLAAAAATLLSGARAAVDRMDARATAERIAREAVGVTAALVRASDSVAVLGDTALELVLRIGSGVACGGDSLELWLPPSQVSAGDPLTSWGQVPEAEDSIALLIAGAVAAPRTWVGATADGSSERVAASPCDRDGGWIAAPDSARRIRVITLRAAIAGRTVGEPVRVMRRGRLAAYVDGRGEWMLGWRRCAVGTCGAVQPVAGPLRTPGSGGFQVGLAADGVLRVSVHAVGAARPERTWVARADALR